MNKLYSISEWIYRLAYINILWILFSIIGLGIAGIFPATLAMFSLIRKWILGETDFPIFQTYWKYYKENFIQSNLIGIIFTMIGFIIYIYLQFIEATADSLFMYIHIPLYIFIFIMFLVFIYVPPVFAHYQVSIVQLFKNAFIIMMMNPLNNVFIVVSVVVTYRLLAYFPVSLLFFGISIIAYIIMWTCLRSFYKFERRQEKLEVE